MCSGLTMEKLRDSASRRIWAGIGTSTNYNMETEEVSRIIGMLRGPVMMPSSIRILLRARQGCYLVVADVEKAFLRVHCGAVSPPFLLAAVIRHLLDEESSKLSAVAKNLYDNVLTANVRK
uniref:Reverse transcriptase domain-containing protein n=1 Tax=Loa loa TaxID=7209 RepID=A0A1I7V8I3_LOALO